MNFDVNVFGWILIMLNLISVILSPLMIGKPRKPYDFTGWLLGVLGFALLLLALGVISF